MILFDTDQKEDATIFAYNLAKCFPIFKTFSPVDLAVNL